MNIQTTAEKVESFKKSFSESFITNRTNKFENVSLYYYSYLSEILPIDKIFNSYFYVINNHLYINDFEFDFVFKHFTDSDNLQMLKKQGVLDYNNFENKKSIDNGIFIKNNYTNAGHSFGNILNIIYDVYNNNNINIDDYNIIIPESLYNYNKFLISIINLFFDEKKIIILKERMLIKCNNLYVSKDNSHKTPKAVNFLLQKLKKHKKSLDSYEYKNIFLIKSTTTQNCSKGAFGIGYNNYLISKGFKCIIPENYSVIELFNIINNAENVIMSWGCCCYLNCVFVNETANILILAHKHYKHEYYKVEKMGEMEAVDALCQGTHCKKKLFIGDLPTVITGNNILLLNSKLLELTT